ncbi:hypothetical protein HDU96_002654 [Phlyctochytrium bullatum]|nr:hypothetical protein HDU96_002654 [Phlyctochytrium bullatum]
MNTGGSFANSQGPLLSSQQRYDPKNNINLALAAAAKQQAKDRLRQQTAQQRTWSVDSVGSSSASTHTPQNLAPLNMTVNTASAPRTSSSGINISPVQESIDVQALRAQMIRSANQQQRQSNANLGVRSTLSQGDPDNLQQGPSQRANYLVHAGVGFEGRAAAAAGHQPQSMSAAATAALLRQQNAKVPSTTPATPTAANVAAMALSAGSNPSRSGKLCFFCGGVVHGASTTPADMYASMITCHMLEKDPGLAHACLYAFNEQGLVPKDIFQALADRATTAYKTKAEKDLAIAREFATNLISKK